MRMSNRKSLEAKAKHLIKQQPFHRLHSFTLQLSLLHADAGLTADGLCQALRPKLPDVQTLIAMQASLDSLPKADLVAEEPAKVNTPSLPMMHR